MVAALFFYIIALILIFSVGMVYNNYKVRKPQQVPLRVVARKVY
jgi:hypothetical protein